MDSQRKMQREITALKDRIVAVAEEKDAEIERLLERETEAMDVFVEAAELFAEYADQPLFDARVCWLAGLPTS
jgi:hypothetical protein